MSQSQHEMVDLLEIYHARNVRDHLLRDLRRLHCAEPYLAGIDEQRRQEIRDYYESMLVTSGALLYHLGDFPR